MSESARERIPHQRRRPLAFVEWSGAFWADGPDRRSWLVKQSSPGWRLEFFEVEDEEPVLAGTYPTSDEAKLRAGRVTGARRSIPR